MISVEPEYKAILADTRRMKLIDSMVNEMNDVIINEIMSSDLIKKLIIEKVVQNGQ